MGRRVVLGPVPAAVPAVLVLAGASLACASDALAGVSLCCSPNIDAAVSVCSSLIFESFLDACSEPHAQRERMFAERIACARSQGSLLPWAAGPPAASSVFVRRRFADDCGRARGRAPNQAGADFECEQPRSLLRDLEQIWLETPKLISSLQKDGKPG